MVAWLESWICNPESRSGQYLELFLGSPEFNSSATLVNLLFEIFFFSPVCAIIPEKPL